MSELLPDLDVGLLMQSIKPEDPFDAIMGFREAIRGWEKGDHAPNLNWVKFAMAEEALQDLGRLLSIGYERDMIKEFFKDESASN